MTSTELRQRLFQFAANPLPRLEAKAHPGSRRKPRAYRYGLALIAGLTVWLLLWLGYRLVWQPAWVLAMPPLLGELMLLVEAAGAFTLSFLWAGLALRHWRAVELPSGEPRRAPATRESLYALSPRQFERYVAAIFRRKGYEVEMRGGSGDHGVDLELHDRRNGRRAIVQCKRYQNTVGEELVRELYGTLLHELAYHAFLVTTAEISDAAREWAQGKPITLIDGTMLVEIDGALFSEPSEEEH
jgi:restriction system protein